MTGSAKKLPPSPPHTHTSLLSQYNCIHLHPPWFKMADGYVTMRSDLESGEENLLTKLLCFCRAGDFMADRQMMRVDLIVVSSLESIHTHTRVTVMYILMLVWWSSVRLMWCLGWCEGASMTPSGERVLRSNQPAFMLLMCVILKDEERRETNVHTHRLRLIPKEVNGWKAILLHDPQAVSLIPAIRKHIEADLTSCRKTAVEICFFGVFFLGLSSINPCDSRQQFPSSLWCHILFSFYGLCLIKRCLIAVLHMRNQTYSDKVETQNHECQLLTNGKRQPFSFEIFL